MPVYPPTTDLSSRTLRHPTGQLSLRRRMFGTRWRRLPADRQALFALAYLWCGDTYAQLASGFGIGLAAVSRCVREDSAVDGPHRHRHPTALRETQAPRYELRFLIDPFGRHPCGNIHPFRHRDCSLRRTGLMNNAWVG
ncbi:hypothetical protein GCM10010329_82610 [Streptomyces spiroverticillatus]|uniref:Transposase Helix-turn-helix domain-containing protein n=1 Tax=Streptomyces finlayi TaxID=67296 RepID=A0A919CGF7_9ACTN|nr:hypothetical protein GCM10010329_82610 [Streptomyces spiroverticillatus]GHD18396.1 hypothetical protein GCM10010334_81200 [Streptomyces finlayi]